MFLLMVLESLKNESVLKVWLDNSSLTAVLIA